MSETKSLPQNCPLLRFLLPITKAVIPKSLHPKLLATYRRIEHTHRAILAVIRRTRAILVTKISLVRNGLYDYRRYWRHSHIRYSTLNETQLAALITKYYHMVEKGLALPEPRPGFGIASVNKLLSLVEEFVERFGFKQASIAALGTLEEYCEFNRNKGVEVSEIESRMSSLHAHPNSPAQLYGGTMELSSTQIQDSIPPNLENFFSSRHSVRQFSNKNVDADLVRTAVKWAQKTPSVCNRQSAKVYMFSGKDMQREILRYQNGNAGFGHQASKILVVTSDLQHFVSLGERFQCWIDGGMFAMSLVYALHGLGLGTCTLNWSVTCDIDKAMRRSADIPENEVVIMLIAVGHLPDRFKVAQSPRKSLSDVLIER